MNSSTTPHYDSNDVPSGRRFYYFYLSIIIFDVISATTATVANSLLLLTIYKDPHRTLRRSPSTNLVINMAVADFLTGSFCAYLLVVYNGLRLFGRSANSLEKFLAVSVAIIITSLIVACCNVVAMACDRWLAVSSALNYRTIVTAKRVNALIVVFWIYAGAFTSFSFFPGIPHHIYDILYCHLHVSVPLIVLPLLYWKTFRALEEHARRRTANLGSHNDRIASRKSHGEKKTTKAFVTILGLFYLAFVPYVFAINLRTFCSVCVGTKELEIFVQIAYRMVLVNGSLDPFVYAWRVPKYRRAVSTVLSRYCIFRRRTNVIDPELTLTSLDGNLGRETTDAVVT